MLGTIWHLNNKTIQPFYNHNLSTNALYIPYFWLYNKLCGVISMLINDTADMAIRRLLKISWMNDLLFWITELNEVHEKVLRGTTRLSCPNHNRWLAWIEKWREKKILHVLHATCPYSVKLRAALEITIMWNIL